MKLPFLARIQAGVLFDKDNRCGYSSRLLSRRRPGVMPRVEAAEWEEALASAASDVRNS